MTEKTPCKISFIIPTKDKPKYLKKCLQNLSEQKEYIGTVIVVASGTSVQHIIDSFKDTLNIQYIHSDKPGQIHQRNLGIDALERDAELVGFFDDDISLQAGALSSMVRFIARKYEENDRPIGVGFNILNLPSYEEEPNKSLRKVFFHIGEKPGEITKIGLQTTIWNLQADIKTQWLGGGYTIWSRQIIEEFKQPIENTRWAIGEDLRYSYPIGKKYNLYVCASAKVIDEGRSVSFDSFYIGYRKAISQLLFIQNHKEFSFGLYLYSTLAVTLIDLLRFDIRTFKGSAARIYAILRFITFRLFNRKRINILLND
jgi:glycosyltransferase involved in cell wall biosynthesis